jgi:hypothetical protein
MAYRDLTDDEWRRYKKMFLITQTIFLVIFVIVVLAT